MLSSEEQEININCERNSKYATAYISDTIYIHKFDKLVKKYPDDYTVIAEHSVSGELVGKTYRFPKKYIRFGHKLDRQMSDERKEAARERMINYHKNKKD